jgi:hypothetical protein
LMPIYPLYRVVHLLNPRFQFLQVTKTRRLGSSALR